MKKRLLGILLSFALMLTIMPLLGLSLTAYADADTWSANKSFDSDESFLDGVNITENITVTIASGKTVTVENGINAEGKTLTVEGGGSLVVGSYDNIAFKGNIIVNGAAVNVTGGDGCYDEMAAGNGGKGVKGNVTVNSGKIIVAGGKGGNTSSVGDAGDGGNGISGNLTVNGGEAYANGGAGGEYGDVGDAGIGVSGTITGTTCQERNAEGDDWTNIYGTTSDKRYVKVESPIVYPLWVGGTQVTSANAANIDGNNKASYDVNSNTLTLNGVTITKGHYVGGESDSDFGIYYNGSEPLIIDLADGSVNTVKIDWGADNEFGIYVGDQNEHHPGLNISGKGKLTVCGSDYGIRAPYITIDECDVTASGGRGIRSYWGSIEIKGGSVYASATSYAIEAYSDAIINAGSKVTASGDYQAIKCDDGCVKNAIAGTGWTNTAGTEGMTAIEVSTTGQPLTNYMKVQFPAAHTHDFTYSASGTTITATCSADSCPLPPSTTGGSDHVATLTIAAPLHTTYGDGNDAAAQITDDNSIKGEADVVYKKGTETLTSAPTDAGTYTASITVGGATASVEYTIAKADPAVTDFGYSAPSNLTYDGNTKTATVTANSGITGMGAVTVNYYSDATCTTVADPVNAGTYYVGITVAEGDNYNATTAVLHGEDWKFTIGKKNPNDTDFDYSAPSNLTYDGNTKTATVTANSGITGMGAVTVNYYSDATCTTVADPVNAGTYYVGIEVTEGDNYKATSSVLHGSSWTFTIAKADPAVTDFEYAAPSNLTYDGNTKIATVTADSGITGMGAVTVNYYSDATCTTVADPVNAGTYYVGITVAEGDNYNATTAVLHGEDWKFTIAPKPVKVSGITASDKTYNGNKTATLVTTGATFEGKLDSDTLTVTATGEFADVNAGQGKTVNISGLTLGGKDIENYTLAATGQQSTTNATISPKSIADATVTLDKTQLTYNGQAQSVSVTGVTTSDGMTLTDADYTASGNTQTDKGDYQVTVTGKGNFTDTATADWKIVEKAMTVKAENVTVTYDGKEHGIKVEVIDPASGAEVKYGTKDGTYDLEESPTIKEPGTLTVYYRVMAGSNYSVYTGKAVVTVNKPAEIIAAEQAVVKGVSKGKTSLKFTWNKVDKAASYEVWMAKCGKKMKKVKTLGASKTSWTKKKLKRRTAYKFYVVAKDSSGNVISRSLTGHAITGNVRGRYTNAKSLSVSQSSINLNKGGTAKISATQKKAKKGKKLCKHAALLRYTSNNPAVATVDSNGNIKAVDAGSCTVYVQTVNGIWKTCNVTVK